MTSLPAGISSTSTIAATKSRSQSELGTTDFLL
jgi:hypothetical protein